MLSLNFHFIFLPLWFFPSISVNYILLLPARWFDFTVIFQQLMIRGCQGPRLNSPKIQWSCKAEIKNNTFWCERGIKKSPHITMCAAYIIDQNIRRSASYVIGSDFKRSISLFVIRFLYITRIFWGKQLCYKQNIF